MFQVTEKTSPQEISEYIKSLREKKGKEKEVLVIIGRALSYGHDFVINLFWEEALTYQHIFMNDSSNKMAIAKMESVVLTAKFYIEKYRLTKWKSRLFRFLGRISDYKGSFAESIGFYKRAIRLSKFDPEPFRSLELQGFLSYALIMSGGTSLGYKLAREAFRNFDLSASGKSLKKRDYQTWVIWRSGIVVRTIDALISERLNFDKKEVLGWLEQIEREIKQGDFSYRRDEVKALRLRLQSN